MRGREAEGSERGAQGLCSQVFAGSLDRDHLASGSVLSIPSSSLP